MKVGPPGYFSVHFEPTPPLPETSAIVQPFRPSRVVQCAVHLGGITGDVDGMTKSMTARMHLPPDNAYSAVRAQTKVHGIHIRTIAAQIVGFNRSAERIRSKCSDLGDCCQQSNSSFQQRGDSRPLKRHLPIVSAFDARQQCSLKLSAMWLTCHIADFTVMQDRERLSGYAPLVPGSVINGRYGASRSKKLS